MRNSAFTVVAWLLVSAVAIAAPPVRDGDIIFHTSNSAQSVAVQRATGSPYSHMGLVLFRDNRPYVFEAAATVRYTPLDKWIAQGKSGHFVAKRLRDAPSVLTPAAVKQLHRTANNFAGRPYDLTFEWSDGRIYCSELVWKVYERALGIRIGELQQIKDFNLNDPTVKAKLRERYGDRIPLQEPVISPAAIFNSPLLITVSEE